MVRTPFARYYRVTVVDPGRGTDLCPYIVRDTYREDATVRTSQDWYREHGTDKPFPSGHTPLLIDWEGV